MASILDVTAALATQLSDVTGIRATDYVPDSIAPPAAFVNVTRVIEGTFGFETIDIELDLVVLVARGGAPRVGQRSLYDFYPLITAAITANADLGLSGTEARVGEYRSLGFEELAGTNYYGGVFQMFVTTPT